MTSENDLIRRAQDGDERAFERLVSMYEQKVYSLAIRYMGNEQDALDVCQETFLRVFRFLNKFEGTSQFSTWLYRIVLNACNDALRKRSNRLEVPFLADDNGHFELEIGDLRFDPASELDRVELKAAIKEGLLNLSKPHMEIIIMRDIAGMSYGEIGKCLSLEQGTVKSRIARARDNLRAFLSGSGNFLEKSQSNK